MLRLLCRTGLVLFLAGAIAGCGWITQRKTGPVEEPPVDPIAAPAPAVAAVAFQTLLPSRDWQVRFWVTDWGKEPEPVQEQLIPDGARLVATYAGVPYVSWVVDDQGLWRQDPKGGGALLRYLPPVLTGEEGWKQTSGQEQVWFYLTPGAQFCAMLAGSQQQFAAGDCWTLTVLNRGERMTLVFAPGLGPVHADVRNFKAPADSFTKRMDRDGPGALGAGDRAAALKGAKPATGEPAPVLPVTRAAFELVARQMEQGGDR